MWAEDFFETVADVFLVINTDLSFFKVNKAFIEQTGWTSQDLAGKNFSQIVSTDDFVGGSYQDILQVLRNQSRMTFSLQTKIQGNLKLDWTLKSDVEKSRIFLSGRPILLSVLEDSERLHRILDGIPAMIGYWNRDLINQFANKVYSSYFAKTPAEIRGIHIKDLLGPKLYEANFPYVQKALAGKLQTFEREIPLPGGGSKHTLANYIPDIKENGEVIGFFVVVMDVGELKLVQNQLEETNKDLELEKNRFSTLVKALDTAASVEISDRNGKLTFVNDRCVEISGFSREDLIGQNHRIFNSFYHSSEFFGKLWETVLSGRSWHGEVCNRRKDGSLCWVDTIVVPVMDLNSQVSQFITIRFDVTNRKNAEKNLLENSKMASLGIMAAGLAHEINNPLAIIKGKVDLLQRKLIHGDLRNEDFLEELRKVEFTVDRITSIVKGLRTFARAGENDPFLWTPVRNILDETLALCRERFQQKDILLKVVFDQDLKVLCREGQIIQVLINLLNNALDAVEDLPEKWIQIDVQAPSKDVIRFSVTDSGKGINANMADEIMSPFFTTKEVGRGTGLGLSISQSIVQGHGGRLFLDRESQNTRFVFDLPQIH